MSQQLGQSFMPCTVFYASKPGICRVHRRQYCLGTALFHGLKAVDNQPPVFVEDWNRNNRSTIRTHLRSGCHKTNLA